MDFETSSKKLQPIYIYGKIMCEDNGKEFDGKLITFFYSIFFLLKLSSLTHQFNNRNHLLTCFFVILERKLLWYLHYISNITLILLAYIAC